MSADCVFCRIAAGSIPSTRVYEDEEVLAFLDIGPVVKGHVLVIPKAHLDPITAVPEATLHRLISVVRMICRWQVDGLRADGVNVTQANGSVAGQVVPHVHFHVIPRFAGDGHSWNWRALSYRDPAEMADYAKRLAAGASGVGVEAGNRQDGKRP